MKSPAISVVMPVYNASLYIEAAVMSVLQQTFIDFEFLILNDGSTDNSEDIILSFRDSRINYLKNPQNMKLVSTLNKGIELARGEFIARMDADDICRPQRFEKQIKFMRANPDVVACGTWFVLLNAGRTIISHPSEHENIHEGLLHTGCVIGHPTAMIKKAALLKSGIRYDERFRQAEDYKLWVDLSRVGKLANIPEVLLDYRIHETQLTAKERPDFHIFSTRARTQILFEPIYPGTAKEIAFIEDLFHGKIARGIRVFYNLAALIAKLRRANQKSNSFQRNAYEGLLNDLLETGSHLCFTTLRSSVIPILLIALRFAHFNLMKLTVRRVKELLLRWFA